MKMLTAITATSPPSEVTLEVESERFKVGSRRRYVQFDASEQEVVNQGLNVNSHIKVKKKKKERKMPEDKRTPACGRRPCRRVFSTSAQRRSSIHRDNNRKPGSQTYRLTSCPVKQPLLIQNKPSPDPLFTASC